MGRERPRLLLLRVRHFAAPWSVVCFARFFFCLFSLFFPVVHASFSFLHRLTRFFSHVSVLACIIFWACEALLYEYVLESCSWALRLYCALKICFVFVPDVSDITNIGAAVVALSCSSEWPFSLPLTGSARVAMEASFLELLRRGIEATTLSSISGHHILRRHFFFVFRFHACADANSKYSSDTK